MKMTVRRRFLLAASAAAADSDMVVLGVKEVLSTRRSPVARKRKTGLPSQYQRQTVCRRQPDTGRQRHRGNDACRYGIVPTDASADCR